MWRGCLRECFLLHGKRGLEINLCRFDTFVAEPQRDDRAIDACLEKVHGHGMAQMPNSAFATQLGRESAGSFADRLRSSKQARARGIDLFGTRKAHEHICLPAHYLAIAR